MKTDTSTPIEIRTGDLKPALVGLGKVVCPRATLPALQCVRVEPVNASTIRLTATDGDLHLRIVVGAQVPQGLSPFLIPLPELRSLVRGMKARDILRLVATEESPQASEFPTGAKFRAAPTELSPHVNARLLRAFSCASRDPNRFVLQGALLDVSGTGQNAHRIVATNGRQLFSSNSMQLPSLKSSVILPDHALWKWKRIKEPTPWTLRVGAERGGTVPFRIDADEWSLTGKTITGSFPNYRQVIPAETEFKTRIAMPRAVSSAIADLIPALPGKTAANRPIGIHVEKGLLSVLAREASTDPWQFYPIGKVEVDGPDQVIFANRDYVRRSLQFGLDEIKIIDRTAAVQFSHEGDLMIVMPVRVNDADKLTRPRKLKPIVASDAKPSGNQASKKPVASPQKTAKSIRPESDPIHEVEARIAEANDALATVGTKLESARGCLDSAREERSQNQEELTGLRSLFNSIRKFAIGSN